MSREALATYAGTAQRGSNAHVNRLRWAPHLEHNDREQPHFEPGCLLLFTARWKSLETPRPMSRACGMLM
jgi:hypothetical protein